MSELSHESLLKEFPEALWDEAAGAVIFPDANALTIAEWLLANGWDLSLIHI